MIFLDILWPVAQVVTTAAADEVTTKDALTVGGFVGIMALIVVGMAKIVGPAYAKWYAQSLDTKAKSEVHNLEVDKEEDKLSIEAKQLLAQQARDSMSDFRTLVQDMQREVKELRKENNKYLIELGELRARDEIRSMEIERLRKEVQETYTTSSVSKQALTEAQGEINQLRLQVDLLQKEMDRLTNQYRAALENNQTLTYNLEQARRDLTVMETELNTVKTNYTRVLTEKDELAKRLLEIISREQSIKDAVKAEAVVITEIVSPTSLTSVPPASPETIALASAPTELTETAPAHFSPDLPPLNITPPDTLPSRPDVPLKPAKEDPESVDASDD